MADRATLKITGLSELANACANYGRQVVAEGRRQAERVAADLVRDQRAAAPVDTGALRDSIVAELQVDPYGVRIVSRARARHASFVEHGTGDTPQKPFFYAPAIRAQKRLAEAQADAIKRLAPAGLGTPQITGSVPLPGAGSDGGES